MVVATSFYPATSQANEEKQEKAELNNIAEQNKNNLINIIPNNTQVAGSMPQGMHMPVIGVQNQPDSFWTDMASRGDAAMSIFGSRQVSTPEADHLRDIGGQLKG